MDDISIVRPQKMYDDIYCYTKLQHTFTIALCKHPFKT
eukprot:UN14524